MSSFPYPQVYPVIGANLSQQLLKQNEQLLVPSHAVSQAFQDLSTISGANSAPQILSDTKQLMPAFLEQSQLSTYYQDNPWEILTSSNKFGVQTPGGDIIPDQPPGYRPGNTLTNKKHRGMPNQMYKIPRTNMPNHNMPHTGREHFGNVEFGSINWG